MYLVNGGKCNQSKFYPMKQRRAQIRDKLADAKYALKNNLVSQRRRGVVTNGTLSMETLLAQAQASNKAFQPENEPLENSELNMNGTFVQDSSRKTYMKELRKVVEHADVMLQILDARDPLGCRHKTLEDEIVGAGKKVVLVLNKIDLIPAAVLDMWVTYLKRDFPVIPFKSSTQRQGQHLSTRNVMNTTKKPTAAAMGTDALMQLLKNYCRTGTMKAAITVGVMGYPNVGKSSVINSLKRSKVARVSSTAGHTKVMQEIQLDAKVKLLDSPGIVFDSSSPEQLVLRNCLNIDQLTDPVPAVSVITSRCSHEQLQTLYKVRRCEPVTAFLADVAKSRGKLIQGGRPDLNAAAKIVLTDWNLGRIPFYTLPPTEEESILETQLVTTFDAPFLINDESTPLAPTQVLDVSNVMLNIPQPTCQLEMRVKSTATTVTAPTWNPTTAVAARRAAKATRKAKRRNKRQTISSDLEDHFCDALNEISFIK